MSPAEIKLKIIIKSSSAVIEVHAVLLMSHKDNSDSMMSQTFIEGLQSVEIHV